MVGKIKAALDARADALIIARTDAIAVEGFDFALERAERYLEPAPTCCSSRRCAASRT